MVFTKGGNIFRLFLCLLTKTLFSLLFLFLFLFLNLNLNLNLTKLNRILYFCTQIKVLKDYYYFLGVRQDASSEEIRKAYRKLSLKYHPDKNDDDVFFQDRFREVQEAYDLLSNQDSRKVYDQEFGLSLKSARSNLPPYIKNFTSNKIRATKGEEIILNWQTNHADLVKILPFGLEKSFGERKFKITEFVDGKFHVVLQATNTLINKSVVKGITIQEISGVEGEKSVKTKSTETYKIPKADKKRTKNMLIMRLLLFLLAIALVLYAAFSS